MLMKIAVVLSVLLAAAKAQEGKCITASAHEQMASIHKECQKESEEATHGDHEACFVAYHNCNWKKIGIFNEETRGIDHDKFVEWAKTHASDEIKDNLASNLTVCKAVPTRNASNKFGAYFDCVENVYATDCPEIAKYREKFRQEFDQVAGDVCKS